MSCAPSTRRKGRRPIRKTQYEMQARVAAVITVAMGKKQARLTVAKIFDVSESSAAMLIARGWDLLAQDHAANANLT
jgi:hypothetical protein